MAAFSLGSYISSPEYACIRGKEEKGRTEE
jgi:hypothetical protein